MVIKVLLIGLLSACYVFVVIGLECYSCDSGEDAECATRPGQQINVEECLRNDDLCVTVISNGVTRRGCRARLFPNNYCPEPCDSCNTSLCNGNVFPADRLRCYQCSGAACINVGNRSELMLPCPVYHEKDRCYTNVININNVMRGCEHTNLPTTCPHVCLKCDYNGCNNELAVYEQPCLLCSYLSTSSNSNCLRSQKDLASGSGRCAVSEVGTCVNKVMYGHAGKCFTYVNEQTGVVERGCSSNKAFYPTGNLTECYGDMCNSGCVPINCNNCTSLSAAGYNCRHGINLRPQKCSEDTFACYSCEQGGRLRRGCVDDDFSPVPDLEACYQCRDRDGCNKFSSRTCFRCSSFENEECNLLQDLSKIPKVNCSAPEELCVTTLVKKFNIAYTLRGCATHVPECSNNDQFCVRCNGSLCNVVQAWPKSDLTKNPFESFSKSLVQIGINSGSRIGWRHCYMGIYFLLLALKNY